MKLKNSIDSKFLEFFSHALDCHLPYFNHIQMPCTDLSLLQSPRYNKYRKSSVLVLLGSNNFEVKSPSDFSILLTKRSETLNHHPGQISFPGGELELHDDFYPTALRETYEEVGLAKENVFILGHLPPLFTLSSNFILVPVVGILKNHINDNSFKLEETEVSEVFWVPLKDLDSQKNNQVDRYSNQGIEFESPVFFEADKKIWGATALIIKNLLDRVNLVTLASD